MRRLIRNGAGFVFMDLTFLVLILFVLALLLLPALAAAREKARRSACMNNLNQLGKALEMYASDYGGYFPCKPAYGAASVTYEKFRRTVARDRGVVRQGKDVVYTNQLPTAKFADSETCGVEDEMCIAFGANADPKKLRANEDDGPWQAGPVGLGYLLSCGYVADMRTYYCPSWNIPNQRFQESCGYDMCNDGGSVGYGQVNTVAAAQGLGGFDARHFLGGNYFRASVTRAGKDADGWYVKSGALGVQSSYVYRNQAVRQPPEADDQARLPVFYTLPLVTTATGCPSFKTQKLLGGRSLVADTFLRSYKDVKGDKPGYAIYHHKDGYNVLYGDWHVSWFGDPEGRIMKFDQGPKEDGTAVKPEGDFAPFDKASACAGTAAGVFADPALKGDGPVSGRATIWHTFDAAAGVDLNMTPLPQ